MLISNLMLSIQTHAEKLTADFVSDLETSPNTRHFAQFSREELTNGARTLYTRLAEWLAEKRIDEIELSFRSRARRQRQAGIPLSEIVWAVMLLKKHVWEFVKRNSIVDSIADLYQRDEAVILIGEFFDRLLYVTVQGYEEGEERWVEPKLFT
jgi:hypothetical protein